MTEPAAEAASDAPIVDADVHIHEDFADLTPFADGPLRRALAAYSRPERWLDTPGLSPLTAYDPPLGEDVRRPIHVERAAAGLRASLDRRGIDAAVVSTGRLLGLATAQDGAYAAGIARAFNRYLRARWLDPAAGIYGAILVAPQEPRAAAAEIEAYADVDGVAAVLLPMAGVAPLWGDRQYEPIHTAACAAGLPVVLHGYTLVYSVFPYQLERLETALAKQTLARLFGAQANLVSMATTGLLERLPELKIVIPECGLTWLPPLLWRLDQQHAWLRHEAPYYRGRPSEAIRRQVYLTTHRLEEPDDPATLLALIGAGGGQARTLFATDWPRYDADDLARVLALPLPPAWRRAILSENAQTAFRLPHLVRRPDIRPGG